MIRSPQNFDERRLVKRPRLHQPPTLPEPIFETESSVERTQAKKPGELDAPSATVTDAPSTPAIYQTDPETTARVEQPEGTSYEVTQYRSPNISGLYLPLKTTGRDKSAEQIRLLLFKPTENPSDALEASLSTVDLYRVPTYFALSYEWGDEAPTIENDQHMRINEYHVPLRANLAEALMHIIEHLEKPVFVWIDAICINQQDMGERGAQVQIMKQIYESAAGVWVWLGLAAENSDLAMDIISQLQLYPEDTKPERSRSNRWLGRLLSDPEYEAERLALHHLLRRPYWKRLWIVQEVVLGACTDMPLLYCGRRRALLGLIFKLAKGICHAATANSTALDPANRSFNLVDDARLVRNLGEHIDEHSTGEVQDLLHTLTRYNENLCSDPRDKVYGVLGVTRLHDAVLTVDYTLSRAELCKRVTRAIEGIAEDDPWQKVPSWVPDWFSSGFSTRAGSQQLRSDASKHEIDPLLEQGNPHIYGDCLQATGLLYGTVAAVVRTRDLKVPAEEDYVRRLLHDVHGLLLLNNTLSCDLVYSESDTETTTAIFVYNVLFCSNPEINGKRSCSSLGTFSKFVRWGTQVLRGRVANLGVLLPAIYDTSLPPRTVFSYHSTLLRPEGRWAYCGLGLCLENAQVGDKIGLIEDCRDLVLLRLCEHPTWDNYSNEAGTRHAVNPFPVCKVVGRCDVPSIASDEGTRELYASLMKPIFLL